MDVKEVWGKAWSLRPGQNTTNMKCVGTIIKSGIRFTYYQDENGGIWFDSEPVEGKPEWMQRAGHRKDWLHKEQRSPGSSQFCFSEQEIPDHSGRYQAEQGSGH